jgi:predicted transcriptional regulator
MDAHALLERLGLDGTESAAYLALLDGPLTVAEIARKAKLHRPAVYRALPRLEEKRLASRVLRGKRLLYSAESPEHLGHVVTELRDTFDEILPDLLRSYETGGHNTVVKFFKGRDGIAFIYDDILKTLKRGDTFYRYSSAKGERRRNAYVPKDYEKRRDAKQLERFVITNARTAARKRKKLDRYLKTIPAKFDLFEYGITQLVYADKIALIDYNSDSATLIQSAPIARFHKKLFQLLFSKL